VKARRPALPRRGPSADLEEEKVRNEGDKEAHEGERREEAEPTLTKTASSSNSISGKQVVAINKGGAQKSEQGRERGSEPESRGLEGDTASNTKPLTS
jgi:hypothetical protein